MQRDRLMKHSVGINVRNKILNNIQNNSSTHIQAAKLFD